jgi:hypothetical protein
LGEVTQNAAQEARRETEEQEPHQEDPGQEAAMRPETAHDRNGIGLPTHQAAARQGDRRTRHEYGGQRRQAQEPGRPIDGRGKLRSSVAGILHPQIRGRGALCCRFEAVDRGEVTGDQESIVDAAGGGYQAGRGDIPHIDHDPRRELEEVPSPIRLVSDHPRNAEAFAAQG